MFPGLIHHHRLLDADVGGGGGGSSAGLVLTADPKPRLRWTADLHDRFVDAVAQLGGPESEISPLLLSPPFSPISGSLAPPLERRRIGVALARLVGGWVGCSFVLGGGGGGSRQSSDWERRFRRGIWGALFCLFGDSGNALDLFVWL